ncbi:hypothetical protein CRG98_042516 [Punica granatum]|uniref:Uncharacterized protein n=1 Tax=Punica granatum TaxID=22663 RepID=A0A2I0HZE5_PUNGR|nr:hypothetical protein CRG98_042516 [Punica granatum]
MKVALKVVAVVRVITHKIHIIHIDQDNKKYTRIGEERVVGSSRATAGLGGATIGSREAVGSGRASGLEVGLGGDPNSEPDAGLGAGPVGGLGGDTGPDVGQGGLG